ncbi:MAG: hypothetical protein ACXVH0_05750 [Thermoanaerobaculia bacterium]
MKVSPEGVLEAASVSLFPRRLASAWLAVAALSVFGIAGTRADLESPNVKKLGRTVSRYRDDTLQIVIGYKHAQHHLESRWILLEACISATGGPAVEIFREDVALIAPDGTRMSMPSQRRMAEGIPDLRRMLLQARVMRDPLAGYFPGCFREERLGFFAVPGEALVFDQVTVDRDTLAWGDLFFESPKGRFEAGIYTLVVENKSVHVRLPLALGIEGSLQRVR